MAGLADADAVGSGQPAGAGMRQGNKRTERKEPQRRTIIVVVALAVPAVIGTAVSMSIDRTRQAVDLTEGAVATYGDPAGRASARVKVAVAAG